MANQASISVTLPEALIDRVRNEVGNTTSFDEVVCVALERELERRNRFSALLREGQQWGRSMGIRSEEDVERIANGELSLEDLKRSA
jgi:Arc/MetJ-type ribon-helix-helix transcriptional regulator